MTIPRRFLSAVPCCLASLIPLTLAAAETPQWTRIGPFGGDVAAIAGVDRGPTYAGTFSGVFRSDDGGRRWIFAGVPGSPVNDLAVDPQNPATVYAATFHGMSKSLDRGATWTRVFAAPSGSSFVWRVAVDPKTPRIVWAALFSGGLWKSLNGGRTWALQAGGPTDVYALAFDPVRPSIVYATRYGGGVFKSVDAGRSWRRIERGLGSLSSSAIAVDPRDGQTLLLADSNTVFKSTDGGEHWSESASGLDKSFLISLAYHPRRSGEVYVATRFDGVYRSLDGGARWQPARIGLEGVLLNAVLATRNGLLAASLAGVHASSNRGQTWRLASDGLSALFVGDFTIDSQDPPRLYVNGPKKQLFKSADRGRSWLTFETGIPLDALESFGGVTIDPHLPTTLYGLYSRGFATSTNGGRRWTPHDFTCLVAGRVVAAATIPTTVYVNGSAVQAGECGRVPDACSSFRVEANGERICLRSPMIDRFGVPVFAADPHTPETLFAKTTFSLFRSTDRGATWSLVPQVHAPDHLVFDPQTPGVVYGTFQGAVGRSSDGGVTWEPTTEGLPAAVPVVSLAVDPSSPSTLYAATADAVFRSTDFGATWDLFAAAPAGIRLGKLAVDPVESAIVYAGTEGASLLMLRQ